MRCCKSALLPFLRSTSKPLIHSDPAAKKVRVKIRSKSN